MDRTVNHIELEMSLATLCASQSTSGQDIILAVILSCSQRRSCEVASRGVQTSWKLIGGPT